MYDLEDDEELKKWYSHLGVDFVMTRNLREKHRKKEADRMWEWIHKNFPEEE